MDQTNTRFSGWAVLAGCILLMIFAAGLPAFTIGLYMYPICGEFGFTNAQYSIALTGSSVVNAVTSLFLVGYLSRVSKGRMKGIMLVSAVITGVGYICCSLCAQLWQFIAVYAFWNIGFNMLTYTPVSMMINNWFPTRSAFLTGIAFAGGNVGGAVFNIVLSQIINTSGWRQSFVIGGIICLAGSLLGVLLVRRSPEEYGQKPYCAAAARQDGGAEQVVWAGVTKSQALKSPAIVFMVISMLFTGIYAGGVSNHVINNLCTDGWDITAAGMVMTIYTIFGIAGNVLSAALINKIGIRKGAPLFALMVAFSLVCLMFAGTAKPLAYVFAAFFGLACVLSGLVPTQAVIVTFGTKDYAGIYGFVYTFYLVGCSIGTPIIALLVDAASYKAAWIVVIALVLLLVFTYAACFRYGERLRKEYSK